jgi:hypothetical protein
MVIAPQEVLDLIVHVVTIEEVAIAVVEKVVTPDKILAAYAAVTPGCRGDLGIVVDLLRPE